MFPIILGMFKPLGEDSGPVLLCPYVVVTGGPGFAALGNFPFSTFDYTDGVATGTVGAESETQAAMPEADANTALPGGTFSSVPANSGKVAMEMEVTVLVPDLTFGVEFATYDGGAQIGAGLSKYLGNLGYWVAEQYGDLVNGLKTTRFDGPISVGDRVGLVVDTDTGLMDFVNPIGHENFSGNSVIDLTNPGTFVMSALQSGDTGSQVKLYTKAADMQLPYPPGTKDPCGNPVTRELVTYPLDASEAELQGIGMTGKLGNPSLAQQRGEYTVLDGTPAGPSQYAMIRSQSDPGFINNWSTGKVAMEWDITVPTFTPEVGGGVNDIVNNLGAVLNAGTFQSIVFIGVVLDENGDRSLSTVIGSNQTITEISQDINRLGLLIDNDTNTLRVWLNGVEQVFNDPSFAANTFDAVTPLASVLRVTTDDNGAAGLKMVNRYITDPYWFTTPFPVGSVDINGNAFDPPSIPQDICIVPSNWQQVGTPYNVPTTNSVNGIVVANNATDVTYGDRSDRIRRIRWDENTGTWSEPGSPFISSTSVRSPMAGLSENRIVYYSDTSSSLVTLDWDEGTSSYSVVPALTTSLDIDYSSSMCGMSDTRIAIATPTSAAFEGLALLQLVNDQWEVVGNVLNVGNEIRSAMCSLDSNTVVYCPEGGSPKVYRHDGTDWQLLADENGGARSEPYLTKVNDKTVCITYDSGTSPKVEFLCFDEGAGTLTISGDDYTLVGTAFADYHYCGALGENRVAVFDRENENMTMYAPNGL